MKEISRGIQAYFKAFQLLSTLKLWKYFFVPVLISLITALIIGLTTYSFSSYLGNLIASIWIWEWGKETFTTISTLIGGVFIITLGFLVFKHIVLAASAPFMGPVSKKIERHLLGEVKEEVSSSSTLLIRGIRISLRNLTRELILTVPILLLGLVPVIGLLSTVLLFLMQAYFAGFGNMDYTLERHFDYKNSVSFVKRNRGVAIGNGIVFMLFLFIPVLGVLLVLPFSVTAATTETIRLIQQQRSEG